MLIQANALSLPIADQSVDSIVTDPPYGLSFMGKDWDRGVPGVAFWIEALRVAKPGAHLLAFGGTRTFHRLACAIEDAGWEIRDTIMWVYGSGFPKSLDVAQAIEKKRTTGIERRPEVARGVRRVDRGCAAGAVRKGADVGADEASKDKVELTTDAAREWAGWGTALKPAWEPIIVARKPLDGTVAANVQQWGTGAINVDGCRIPVDAGDPLTSATYVGSNPGSAGHTMGDGWKQQGENVPMWSGQGRWPANLIHDGSDEVLAGFPQSESIGARPAHRGAGTRGYHGWPSGTDDGQRLSYDSGSAARFFYCAKASSSERGDDNNHPTVKPLALMRYLVRLVTRPGGLVLDQFCGSGTTGRAAVAEGMRFVGCDLNLAYLALGRARLTGVQQRLADLDTTPGEGKHE